MSGLYALAPYLEQQPLYDRMVSDNREPWNGAAPYLTLVSFSQCPSNPSGGEPTDPNRQRGLNNYGFCAGDSYSGSQAVVGGTQERDSTAISGQKLPLVNRGIFGRCYPKMAEITDGTSNTIAIVEFKRPNNINHIGMVVGTTGDPTTFSPLSCKAQWNYGSKTFVNPSLVFTGDTARGFRGWEGKVFFAGVTTILPPNSPSCFVAVAVNNPHWCAGIYSGGSFHAGGVQIGMADGSVRFISDTIDAGNQAAVAPTTGNGGLSPYGVWGGLGSKSGGETVQSE